MPTVVIAPDSFKGTIAAADAAAAIADGWARARPRDRLVLRPMADGGEGTLDAIAAGRADSVRIPVEVTGPDGATVTASWLRLPPDAGAPHGTGVVELAAASGLELLGDRRVPLDAHTLGFGQAIAAALAAGVSRLLLAIGGSASTDGGTGMLTALGARILDVAGTPVPLGARGLGAVAHVDLTTAAPPPPAGAIVLCDVASPLLGPTGAAAVFGPQKGLDAAGVRLAEAGLARLARHLDADPEAAGAGAAGGVGFALAAWGATSVSGARRVAELIGLPVTIAEADAVVTGEGAFDPQTDAGKAPALVAALAREHGVPALLVAGRLAADPVAAGFADAVELAALAGSVEAAIADPRRFLVAAGIRLAEGDSLGGSTALP